MNRSSLLGPLLGIALLLALATPGNAAAPPAAKSAPPPPATAPRPAVRRTPEPGKPSAALGLAARRPIVLDALRVEGKTDAPRVLFVHAGPTVALEDAPAHPSYLRDDFTAALSSPVRVRVRTEPLRSPNAGGNR